MQGHGAVLRTSLHETVTPEFVNAAWSKVTDMSRSTLCENSAQALGNLMNVIDEMKLLADEQQQPKLAANEYQSEFVFGAKDLVLYALGGKCYCPSVKCPPTTVINFLAQIPARSWRDHGRIAERPAVPVREPRRLCRHSVVLHHARPDAAADLAHVDHGDYALRR